MEKNQKNKTTDLLERAIYIAELANKCYLLGLIEDYKITVDVTTEVDYEVDVRVDAYRAGDKRWCVSEKSYRETQEEPTGSSDEMTAYLQKLLDDRKANIMAELEIMEG